MDTINRIIVKAELFSDNGGHDKEETIAATIDGNQQKVRDLKQQLLEKLSVHEKQLERYELRIASNDALLPDTSLVRELVGKDDILVIRPKRQSTSLPPGHINITSIYNIDNQYKFLKQVKPVKTTELDGSSLTIEELVTIGMGVSSIKLSDTAIENVKKSRKVIDDILKEGRVVYGINTGFGKFANVLISNEDLVELQENLIRSHATCVGQPLSPFRTRMLLTLRINILAKGFSGIRLETLQQLVDALNANCLSRVPEKGTVGASGDLAPLSHLALGMMGEGLMWSPETSWGNSLEVLNAHGLNPISLKPKEGIALINGTQFIASLGCEALHRAKVIAKQADVVAALSIDVLQGTPRAFDRDIHLNRPHAGQQLVASRLRGLLDSNVYSSEIREGHKDCNRVQDPYSMRCVPQVHGIVHDTIEFVRGLLTTEINSATDNPMVLSNRDETISGGNFHGEYPAKALDYLAIGIHEIANISERRIERLIHPAYNSMPAFLVKEGGLNSGFMIAHCTAAALVSENKVLTHPSSVDSITTSAGTEDHVSMGGFSARKAVTVVEHVENVVAIELLAACQALEFHRPMKTTAPLEEVYKLVRSVAPAMNKDRYIAPDIQTVVELLQDGKIWNAVQPYLTMYDEVLTMSPNSGSAHSFLSSTLRQMMSPKADA